MGERLPEFSAQVGGHKILKVYRDNYVCKPYDRRECKFYHKSPTVLEPFIPQFAGILSVGSADSQDDFIMLENLTAGYTKPCVLDLKMGTRMYGDFATEKKRRSQDIKTKQTTSGKLGVRLCGYQRYSRSSHSFQRVDKYVGRTVDVEKFEELLESFFTVGGTVQGDVICSVIEQAERLRRVVMNLESYRFYSSSLLIVFEGETESALHMTDESGQDSREEEEEDSEFSKAATATSHHKPPVLKLIDFANVTFPGFCKDDIFHEGPDQGFLFGLNNLITILETIWKKSC